MKVLLKSLEELEEEFTIVEDDYYLIIDGLYVLDEMIDLLGKVHIAEYEEKTDSYVINGWRFNPSFITVLA